MSANLEIDALGRIMAAGLQVHKNRFWYRGSEGFDLDRNLLPAGATVEDFKAILFPDGHEIVKRPLFMADGAELSNHMAVVRLPDQKVLAVASPGFEVMQIDETFNVMNTLVDEGVAELQTMVSLNGGKEIVMAAKIVGDVQEVIPGDVIESYLTAGDSWGKTSAWWIALAQTLTVCANTRAVALQEAKRNGRLSSHRHTKGLRNQKDAIMEQFGIVQANAARSIELMRAMAQVKVNDSTASDFFGALLHGGKDAPVDVDDWTPQRTRKHAELMAAKDYSPGQELEGRKDTVYGLLNAVTFWTSNVQNQRGKNASAVGSVLNGTGAKINALAEHLLVNQYQLAA